MAVLSRAGCNQGICHGNRNGKGGFKLSLRGQDPRADFVALTQDAVGRRLDRVDPARSLILRKPTLAIPHEGGLRFDPGSEEYATIRSWIEGGALPDRPADPRLVALEVSPGEELLIEPSEETRITARARFSDGTARDVTAQAVYEPTHPIVSIGGDGRVRRRSFGETTVIVRYLDRQEPVRLAFVPARPDFVWSDPPRENFIDDHVFAKLRARRIAPSPPADDAVFLRRVHLDIAGVLPTAEEVASFEADSRPDKRKLVVDRLLERPELADLWALKWADLLRVEERTLDRKGVHAFHGWIRSAMASGMPLDRFARELLSARGSTYKDPATNFYRAHRDPATRGEAVAQVFLGTRLQCARCHNHPFDRWTQDDYHGWAAAFAPVGYKVLENRRTDTNDQLEFKGEQVVHGAGGGNVVNLRTGEAARPRFLGDPDRPTDGGLDALAAWVTSPANRLFARVQANRIWAQLLGRGIVEPPDDFRATNPPSHPELLDALADELVRSGFDLRHMIRLITSSRTYALSAEPGPGGEEDPASFSHALVRRLSAEQILDCQSQVLGVPAAFGGYPAGLRASELPGAISTGRRARVTPAEKFLRTFGRPPRAMTCECERSGTTTLSQALQLVSGPVLHDLLERSGNRIDTLLAAGKKGREAIDELYRSALSRRAGEEEAAMALEHLELAPDPRAALEDICWSLLASQEFVLRR